MFNCDKCGECCKNLNNSKIYSDLNRGDGVCIHYDELTHLCNIYDDRPLICRIDDMFDYCFQNEMTKEEYYRLNYESCKILKEKMEG